MKIALILPVAALIAAIYLAFDKKTQIYGFVGAICAGLHVAIAMGWIALRISGINLGLFLAVGVLVAGVGAWTRTNSKMPVTAAAALALIGALRLIRYL